MQYTAFGFRWNEESVGNLKPEYQQALDDSRTIGMMDVNIDGRVAKDEVRGRMAQMLLSNWDKVDANGDGYLQLSEMDSINKMMSGRINAAQAQQSIGQ
jgi:Ca2+-binding EF-hand superfamily protein